MRMSFIAFLLANFMFFRASGNMLSSKRARLRIEGDVMIGGLVAIHDAGGVNNLLCSSNISMFGIMRLEAMRYAIDKINKDPNLLYGLKLGIEIRDTCGTETIALDESLQFVISKVPACENNNTKPFYGVVGDGMSMSTASAASLLSLFKVPLVSYGATSTELSDQSKYSFLLRTVPPDSYQSLAMLDFIVEKLNWRSVYGLYSTGSYGEHGFASFSKATENSSLCIADKKKIPPGASVSDLQLIIKDFYKKQRNIKGIVCYCEIPDAKNIVQAIKEENLTTHYRLIGSDSWYQVKSNNTIIFSLFYNSSYIEDFYNNWYSSLSPNNFTGKENIWFQNFWVSACQENVRRTGSKFNCSDPKNSTFKFCLNSTIEETCQRDDVLSYTIDAVYAIAHAIHNVIQKNHGENTTLFMNESINGQKFFTQLKNVSFFGNTGLVKFPVDGHYNIYCNSKGHLKLIGMWHSNRENERLTIFNETEFNFKNDGFEFSTCQDQCNDGWKKVYTSSKKCCWICEQCKFKEYLTRDECKICPEGSLPNRTFDGCTVLPRKPIDLTWFIITAGLAVGGFVATFLTIITLLRHNSTPLVRASGREVTYLLLVSILFLYILPIFLLVSLTPDMCKVFRFGLGLCLSICHISLLIKTNRIARIFSGRQDLLFLTPHWQLVLTGIFLVPQLCFSFYGFFQNEYKLDYNYEKRYSVLKCYTETNDFYATVAYNLVLVFLTTYYAFKTRKVPSNFNEARYIGFVMYTTIVTWLAFLPIFFGSSTEYKTIAVMLDTIIVSTTFLVGLYGVKIYIIKFRPNKNRRIRSVTFFQSKSESSNGTVVIEDCK